MICSSFCGKSMDVLGPSDSIYLLRATALELFSLRVDPVRRTLRPPEGVIGRVRVGGARGRDGVP